MANEEKIEQKEKAEKAEKNEKSKKSGKKIGLKPFIGYALFFAGSFLITFCLLYIIMRGFQNPFANLEQIADSMAVVADSTAIAAADTQKAENTTSAEDTTKENVVTDEKKDLEAQVNTLAHEKLLEKEKENNELQQQIEVLKFAYEENQKRYKELAVNSISSDSLNKVIVQLEKDKSNVGEKEGIVAELDSVTEKLKSLVQQTTLTTRDKNKERIEVDSLKKVLAALEHERSEKKKQAENIETLKKQIEGIDTKTDVARNTNVKKLAKVYESMKPADAAHIMTNLEDNLVIELLQQIKQRQAAKILSELPPPRAAKISQAMGNL